MTDQHLPRLERCEETRKRILRGDGLIGILPADEVNRMIADYRALGEANLAPAWVGLALYYLDDNGLHPSVMDAAECLCRAVSLGSREARDMLKGVIQAVRAQTSDDPPHARSANEAVERVVNDDPDGSVTYLAGLFAFHGFGRPKDLPASVRLHEVAAARGNADSMFELFAMLSSGTGTARDDGAALEWCIKAAERGHARACYNVGVFYATGRGVPRDEVTALHYYERASAAGNGRATATLAYMVHIGSGCTPDPTRAEELLALAEEQGVDIERFRADVGF